MHRSVIHYQVTFSGLWAWFGSEVDTKNVLGLSTFKSLFILRIVHAFE